MALTDKEWALLDPLVEACRPHNMVPPQDLRWTMGAIFWRHDNGARWRSLPVEEGPWWMAAQTFIRWSHIGVWDPLLIVMREKCAELGGTVPRDALCHSDDASTSHVTKAHLRVSGASVKHLSILLTAVAGTYTRVSFPPQHRNWF